jgi:hypothetical protein
MDGCTTNSPARIRWFHWVMLGVILCAGAAFRFRNIGRESLWIDEYWTLYQATGRGDALFQMPTGVVLDSPACSAGRELGI